MPIVAKLSYLRISPRKVRLVADLIRGKTVKKAQDILAFAIQKTAVPLLKLLKSAIANAHHNFGLEELNLYVSKIIVDEGPKLKRFRQRARGQTSEIQKKTSHITLVLDEIEKGLARTKEAQKSVTSEEKIGEKKIRKSQKPKRPKAELRFKTPKVDKSARRIFARKAF